MPVWKSHKNKQKIGRYLSNNILKCGESFKKAKRTTGGQQNPFLKLE